MGEHLDKLANIVTTVVVPLFLPQTPLYEKRFIILSGDPVKAICLINKDDAIQGTYFQRDYIQWRFAFSHVLLLNKGFPNTAQ